ncbi:uncharacterized protein C2orf92 homolog isoform X4 [Mesocricetus auratus]|uniref:Uncharacterized protein C2orf92 homolog isoform X4 n=1 Tax=Mesocricetus auratus TaxID=10036 RepID=A0ABM2W4C4_MESAU|nr:uncharacterized protein C2orf92 homolog isoform X4 [Mesocricetus auratus]
MRDTVFFSFVLFLGSQWGIEPHSIPVTEGTITSILSWQLEGWKTHREPQADRLVGTSCRGWDGAKNSLSSSSKHLDEDLAKLFDEILLQVFPNNLDDITKDARTAGRLITWSDVNETHHSPNSFNNSEFASSSHKQEEHLAKIFVVGLRVCCHLLQEAASWAREVAPQLRAVGALAEDLGLISGCMVAPRRPTPVPEYPALFSGLCGYQDCTRCTDIQASKTLIHINQKYVNP